MYIQDVVKQHHALCIFKCCCGYTYYRQWQREAEENAEQRYTIERYNEQIADMSEQFE